MHRPDSMATEATPHATARRTPPRTGTREGAASPPNVLSAGIRAQQRSPGSRSGGGDNGGKNELPVSSGSSGGGGSGGKNKLAVSSGSGGDGGSERHRAERERDHACRAACAAKSSGNTAAALRRTCGWSACLRSLGWHDQDAVTRRPLYTWLWLSLLPTE